MGLLAGIGQYNRKCDDLFVRSELRLQSVSYNCLGRECMQCIKKEINVQAGVIWDWYEKKKYNKDK